METAIGKWNTSDYVILVGLTLTAMLVSYFAYKKLHVSTPTTGEVKHASGEQYHNMAQSDCAKNGRVWNGLWCEGKPNQRNVATK